MLVNFLALALAGGAQRGFEAEDPENAMAITNLTIATYNAGACASPPDGSGLPTTPASIELTWRASNRDDVTYRIRVYLTVTPQEPVTITPGEYELSLGSNPELFDAFGTRPSWTQAWQAAPDSHLGYGRFSFNGRVENGDRNRESVNWLFRVAVERISDGVVLASHSVPWRKTYGTCALPGGGGGDDVRPNVRQRS